jgi:aspartyl/asparaginyl-tRNA synthetase
MTHRIPVIDYKLLADAKDFYEKQGFVELSVPWIIEYGAYSATCPPHRKEFYTLGGYLNASGEQSFLQLLLEGVVLKKHFCITPCFRAEPVCDEFHHVYFMKLELIDTDATEAHLHEMIACAKKFYDSCFSKETHIIQTDKKGQCFDIVDALYGIELGSYGIRRYKGFSWIYGTGVALPRISTVIKKYTYVQNNHGSRRTTT